MSYVILGRKVASEYLALGTLGAVGGLTALSMRGGSKPKANPAKELSSTGSKEEEDLTTTNSIKNFMAEAEKEDKQKH